MEENKKFVIRCRAIIIDDEGKLLVVRHPHDTSFAALPGGHLEWGEDIKECLTREIVEELGLAPEIGRLLYINNFMDGTDKQSVEFFFEVVNSQDFKNLEGKERSHIHEIAGLYWADPGDDIQILPKRLMEDFKIGNLISDQVRYIHNK